MPKIVLPQKSPLDTIATEFDFSSYLSVGEELDEASVTVTVYSGVDANPSGIVSGSADVGTTTVTQKLTGGISGVLYTVTCTATTDDDNTISLIGYLSVLPGTL